MLSAARSPVTVALLDTVILLPIITSLGRPTVQDLSVVKSCAPPITSISLFVPDIVSVVFWSNITGLFWINESSLVSVSAQLDCTLTSAPVARPVSLVRSAEVIIAPEPALVTSDNSVTLCVERSVTSVGLFCIKSSAAESVSFQSDWTLTSALASILLSLVSSVSVKSLADNSLPATISTLPSNAVWRPAMLDMPRESKVALFASI